MNETPSLGRMKSNPATATMKDVARAAGVSTATVSAVINGSSFVSDPLRDRVLAAIASLNYAPSRVARSLRTQTTRLVGVIVADITNPFFTQLVRHIGARLQAEGYSMLLCETDHDPEREAEALALLAAHGADGVILAPSGPAESYRSGPVAQFPKPIVMADRSLPGMEYDWVVIDNVAAAREVTDYIISLGHRRIGTITGGLHLATMVDRMTGFEQALASAGLSLRPEDFVEGEMREETARLRCREAFAGPSRPSALFVSNNLMVIGVMRALADLGLRCPDDVSIAAIDDFPWAEAFHPGLTVQSQPIPDIADQSVRLLLRRIAARHEERLAPEHVTLRARLVLRQSCRAWRE